MFARFLAPIPLATAIVLGASVAGLYAAQAVAAVASDRKEVIHPIKLSTGLVDGKMVYLDAQGKANPVLRVNVGDTVDLTVRSGEGAEHDFVIPELGVHSKHFNASTGPVRVKFKVTRPGKFTYYCSIAGHRQIGMEGTLEVAGDELAQVASRSTRPLRPRLSRWPPRRPRFQPSPRRRPTP